VSLFSLALGAAGRFFRKKAQAFVTGAPPDDGDFDNSPPPSEGGGLSEQENQDLGLTSGTGGDVGGGAGGPLIPGGAQGALGMITASPGFVVRAKCPAGYSFIHTGPSFLRSMVGRPAGTCVLTKVARALGLVHRRRGRGISARDLRATLRVTRLVKHVEHMLPKSRSHFGGHKQFPRAPSVRVIKGG